MAACCYKDGSHCNLHPATGRCDHAVKGTYVDEYDHGRTLVRACLICKRPDTRGLSRCRDWCSHPHLNLEEAVLMPSEWPPARCNHMTHDRRCGLADATAKKVRLCMAKSSTGECHASRCPLSLDGGAPTLCPHHYIEGRP